MSCNYPEQLIIFSGLCGSSLSLVGLIGSACCLEKVPVYSPGESILWVMNIYLSHPIPEELYSQEVPGGCMNPFRVSWGGEAALCHRKPCCLTLKGEDQDDVMGHSLSHLYSG